MGVKMAFQSKMKFQSGCSFEGIAFEWGFERRWVLAGYARIGTPMTLRRKATAVLTDSHFLVPLIVFCIGLALLITLH